MNPEFIKEVRRTSSQTALRAQRIVEKLQAITSKPPPEDDEEPEGDAEE